MKKTLAILATVVLAVLFVGVPAWADIVDPATLQIGDGGGGSNPTGELQNDPVYVGTTNFSIYQNSGGPALLDDPLVVILAVPDTGTLTGSISSATLYNPYSIYPGGGTSLTIRAAGDPDQGQPVRRAVRARTVRQHRATDDRRRPAAERHGQRGRRGDAGRAHGTADGGRGQGDVPLQGAAPRDDHDFRT